MYLTTTQAADAWNESVDDRRRGFNVYSNSQLATIFGKTKTGNNVTMQTDAVFFDLTPFERFEIFRKSSFIFGFITGRMNRISATDWEIVPEKKIEDRLAEQMKFAKGIYKELQSSMEPRHLVTKARIIVELRERLPELLPDLSNFDMCLIRWKKRILFDRMDQAEEIEDWLWKPNPQESWVEFQKKWVQDLMVHGAGAIHYQNGPDGHMDNIYILPGGSVIPLKEKYVGNVTAWAQIMDSHESQVFFGDELCWSAYYPTSARAYPLVPLEALINKVAESLLFDKKMAEEADGTKPVEKAVIFGKQSSIGDFEDSDFIGMDVNKQHRIESKLNSVKKEAIATISGVGTPTILDLSKRDTMGVQLERQKLVREEAALVFNLSPMEANLGGGDNTSGRSTAEEQGAIDKSRGWWPLAFLMQTKTTRDMIPRKFPRGYHYQYKEGQDEMAELQKNKLKVDSGLYSVNQIRTEDLNEMPFDGEEFDKPKSAGQASPDGSETSPLFFSQR